MCVLLFKYRILYIKLVTKTKAFNKIDFHFVWEKATAAKEFQSSDLNCV